MIDLRDGRAVRGRAGARERYVPVRSVLAPGSAGDPAALLAAYRAALRPDTVYIADLDRITGRGDNDAVLDVLMAHAPDARFLWDGGLSDSVAVSRGGRDGRLVPVIATETLRSIEDLRAPSAPCVPGAVLSLDLRAGGVVSKSGALASLGEERILMRARACGFRSVILLLLDRVGTSSGLPLDRLIRLRGLASDLDIMTGGGIASLDDLLRLRDAGFSGALVATALHEGLISPENLERHGFTA
ncbi:MAG TPA: HisA/HisF-related TIM barrel protein [Candidatus Polarisedimenticolia bacterium]|nr:HisA/HisF-related TIM barrel protein [Candidatus Polarisedimenticolia bacterium]